MKSMTALPGFRFHPTAEDLLFYLSRRLNGYQLPEKLIEDIDLYSDNPFSLFHIDDAYKESRFYVFTDLKKLSQKNNGRNITRKAGSGTWSGRCTTLVKDSKEKVIGVDRYFTFSVKTNGYWTMHEYSLLNENGVSVVDNVVCVIVSVVDNVVCVITRKKETSTEHPISASENRRILHSPIDEETSTKKLCMDTAQACDSSAVATTVGDTTLSDCSLVITSNFADLVVSAAIVGDCGFTAEKVEVGCVSNPKFCQHNWMSDPTFTEFDLEISALLEPPKYT